MKSILTALAMIAISTNAFAQAGGLTGAERVDRNVIDDPAAADPTTARLWAVATVAREFHVLPSSAAKFNHFLSIMAPPRCDKTLCVLGTRNRPDLGLARLKRNPATKYPQ